MHNALFIFVFRICFNRMSRQWLKSEDIQRISLFFHNKSLEKEVGMHTMNQPALFTGKTNQWDCIVVREQEIIKEAGQSYSPQMVYFQKTAPQICFN